MIAVNIIMLMKNEQMICVVLKSCPMAAKRMFFKIKDIMYIMIK